MDSKTKSTTKKKSESENILLERIERSNGGEDGVHSQSNNVGSSQKMKNSGGMGQDQPNDSVGIEIGTLDSTLHQKTENSAEQDTSEARNADIREDIPVDSVINLPTPCSEANTSTSTPTSEPGPFPSLFSQFRYIIANFSNRFSDIPRRSKILMYVGRSYTLLKIVTCVLILCLTMNQSCDQPLRLFLIFTASLAFASGITDVTNRVYRTDPERHSNAFLKLSSQLAELWVILSIILFFFGNMWLFTSKSCSTTSKPVFYLSVTLIVLNYMMFFIPVILLLSLVFCFPLVLLFISPFVDVQAPILGATQSEIDSIKVARFKPKENVTETAANALSASLGTQKPILPLHTQADGLPDTTEVITLSNEQTGSQSRSTLTSYLIRPLIFFSRPRRNLFSRKKGSSASPQVGSPLSASVPILNIEDTRDAVCAICLAEYTDDDMLRILKCDHHFHQSCIDQWLKINRLCPFCKKDCITAQADTSQQCPPSSSNE